MEFTKEMLSQICVIIPSYEPDEKLLPTVNELYANGISDIIIVNDGSSENCKPIFEKVKKLSFVTYLEHKVNSGKGVALKTAFDYVLKKRSDSLGVITADGDGQHLTKDIIACIKKMLETESVVLGCRDFSLPDVPERSRKGNNITRNVFKKVFKIDISDTQTGLRAFPMKYLPDMLETEGERYEYENKMLLTLRDRKIPFCEQKIDTVYIEENKTSHFRPVADSLRIYYHLFSGFIKYVASSLFCVIVENILQTVLHDILKIGVESAGEGFLSTVLVELVDFLPARLLASLLNYYINKHFVFKSRKHTEGAFKRYVVLWAIQAVVTLFCIAGLELLLGGTGGIVYFLIISVVKTAIFFASYTVQKKWVFADKKD